IKIFLRSLFMQSGWNFERCQNIGFCFALMPHFKKIWTDSKRLKTALLRHFGIFNTQPYMAGFIIGNICSIEEKISSAKSAQEEEKFIKSSINIKSALASSFASIGDRIFWGRLTPLATILCLIAWGGGGFYGWFLSDADPEVSMYILFSGPVLGASLIICASLYIRWKGLGYGYDCGGSKLCGLEMFPWTKIISRLSMTGLVLSILIFIFSLISASMYYYKNFGIEGLLFKAILVMAAIGIFLIFRRLKKSIFLVLATLLIFSTVVVMIAQIEGIALIL
ncbi:MAG: PTS system mannose/fructose/sorbose family transporter subunit IID, partial [Elusimicrobiota bacterium]|nr:PTS system mannose/fructose/sorbose family transporter subunit IID [Elusimicrobiota bacterium]